MQRGLDRLEDFGFIKEVPDTNPTGRKFLLLWLDDPTYLPPIRKPKEKPKRSNAKARDSEEVKADVVEWARNRVRELAEDGRDETSIYDLVDKEFVALREHSNEEWGWHEAAKVEALNEHFETPWKPADLVKPTEMQVTRWVYARLGEIIAADPNRGDPEEDLYSELDEGLYDETVWSWFKAAIKQASAQTLHENV